MAYTITTDPARIDVGAIHAMLRTAYWSPRVRRDVVEEALRHSLVALAIDDDTGQTVGLARLVTDYATFAWLCDVFIAEPHRGRGIAKRLLTEFEAHPRLKTLRRWCLATRDAHTLYARFGYQPVDAQRWMEKRGVPSAWQEAEPPAG